jgi:hypothetical protein
LFELKKLLKLNLVRKVNQPVEKVTPPLFQLDSFHVATWYLFGQHPVIDSEKLSELLPV